MQERPINPKNKGSAGLSGRRFLLLQGPSSPFFSDLGDALRTDGAYVARIGFCPGDKLFWRRSAGDYHPFRGPMSDFSSWLAGFVADHSISDIVMLGDGRAPHAAAVEAKELRAIDSNIWIVEHGYLRPNLILVEPEGMGGRSRIRSRYNRRLTVNLSEPTTGWPPSFLRYATFDITYHIANVLLAPFFYRHYRAHSGISPLREYSGWCLKALRLPMRRRTRKRSEAKIARHKGPLFLFPLQLSQDFQVTRYGTGQDQREVLRDVMASFRENAPCDALLVVKVHPLDNGLTNWVQEIARCSDVGSVVFLDGGNLDKLLSRAEGAVTINSTVGLLAILAGCPTCVLGQAVYDVPGLTFEGQLCNFWRSATPPDPDLAAHFSRYLRSNWHVPGAFDGPGSLAGANALAAWFAAPPYLMETEQ